MIETTTIIEAIYYVLKKIKKADKIKLVKLIYLADKYHLIRYGRTITNDDYYAMQHGPVGTTVKDVLSLDPFSLSRNGYKYAARLLKQEDDHDFIANPNARVSFDMLSETDIEALDFIVDQFGNMGPWKLRDYTHKYPEWKQYKDLFENKRSKRERLHTKELLSTFHYDFLKMPNRHIQESANILSGMFN